MVDETVSDVVVPLWDQRWKWLAFDLVAVLGFVIIGRDTHNEGNALLAVAGTAAPFIGGVIAAWVATDAARRPLDLRTGAAVAAITWLVGLAIRRIVFGDGIALPFVVVAIGFLASTMLGWRFVASRVLRR